MSEGEEGGDDDDEQRRQQQEQRHHHHHHKCRHAEGGRADTLPSRGSRPLCLRGGRLAWDGFRALVTSMTNPKRAQHSQSRALVVVVGVGVGRKRNAKCLTGTRLARRATLLTPVLDGSRTYVSSVELGCGLGLAHSQRVAGEVEVWRPLFSTNRW